MFNPATTVSSPQGGGLDIATQSMMGSAPGAVGGAGSALGTYTKALMDRVLQKADEAHNAKLRADRNPSEGLESGPAGIAQQYALQQMRDKTLEANQQAAPTPTKTISGPQIIPGQVPDSTKILMANQPKNGQFSAGGDPSVVSGGGSSPAPSGLPTGDAASDDAAAASKQLQIAALSNALNRQGRIAATGQGGGATGIGV